MTKKTAFFCTAIIICFATLPFATKTHAQEKGNTVGIFIESLENMPDHWDVYEQAMKYLESKRYQTVLKRLQQINDEVGYKMKFDEKKGVYTPIHKFMTELLLSLPDEARETYCATLNYETRARDLLQKSCIKINLAELQKIGDLYFITDSGAMALQLQGHFLTEKGSFHQTIPIWKKLAKHPNTKFHLRSKISLALTYASIGEKKAAETIAVEIKKDHADATIDFGKKTIPLFPWLTKHVALMASKAIGKVPANPLPVCSVLAPQKEYQLKHQQNSDEVTLPNFTTTLPKGIRINVVRRRRPYYPVAPAHPTVTFSQDKLYVLNSTNFYAMDAKAPKYTKPLITLSAKPIAGGPVIQKDLIIFPNANLKEIIYNKATGKFIPLEGVHPEHKAILAQAQNTSIPAVENGVAYLCLGAISRGRRNAWQKTYLASFDISTGKLIWINYIAMSEQAHASGYPAQLKIGTTKVFCAVNHRMIFASNKQTGQTEWLSAYRGAQPKALRNNPIIESSGIIVVAPEDAPPNKAWALDAATGETKWVTDKSLTGKIYLIGSDGDTLYLSADTIYAYDITTGKVIWKSPLIQGPKDWVANRPALTRDSIVVAYTNMLATFDRKTGNLINKRLWASHETADTLGDFCVSENRIYMSSSKNISAFRDQSYFDKVFSGLKKNPNDQTLLYHKANNLLLNNKPEDAKKLFMQVLANTQDKALRHYCKAALFPFFHKDASEIKDPKNRWSALKKTLNYAVTEHDVAVTAVQLLILKYAEIPPAERATQTYTYLPKWKEIVGIYQLMIQHCPQQILNVNTYTIINNRRYSYANEQTIAVSAKTHAINTIATIIKSQGPTVYETQEKQAQEIFAKLKATDDYKSAKTLIEHYPNSQIVTKNDALLFLCKAAIRKKDDHVVTDYVPDLLKNNPKMNGRLPLQLALAESFERLGNQNESAATLRSIKREHGQSEIIVDGKKTRVDAWVREKLQDISKTPGKR